MIPKTIHALWFSKEPMPELYKRCLESWKKNSPDYEIKIWDLENYKPDECLFFEQAIEHKNWAESKTYCENLEEDGFSDWRLPTVSELRTLVRNCDKTAPGGSCGITDECTKHSDCWSIDCSGCSSAEIKTNVFGDGPYKFFWSSQSDVNNNTELVIAMLYYDGSIGYLQPDNNQGHVRCIR